MANAAAKKAAKAKQKTTSFYKPALMVLNLLHLVILYSHPQVPKTKSRCVLTFLEWILTYTSYNGIVHTSQLGATLTGGKERDLKGGVYLDVLGLVLVVQFGSLLISPMMDYLLIILPVSYALKWYKGDGESSDNNDIVDEMDEGATKELEERRRKRAERRRLKRS